MKIVLSLLALSLLLLVTGCKSIHYTSPDGRAVQIIVFGYDTKIGHLEATAPDGTKLTFDNLDTQATAIQTANKALDLANTVASHAP